MSLQQHQRADLTTMSAPTGQSTLSVCEKIATKLKGFSIFFYCFSTIYFWIVLNFFSSISIMSKFFLSTKHGQKPWADYDLICNAYVWKNSPILCTQASLLPPRVQNERLLWTSLINMHDFAKSSKVTYMTRFGIHYNCVLCLWDLADRITLITDFLPLTVLFWRGCWTYVEVFLGDPGHSKYLVLDSLDTSFQLRKWLLLAVENGC